MNSLAEKFEKDFYAAEVRIDDGFLYVTLTDGREIKTPLEFYPRLLNATDEQRSNFKLLGLGSGIHWPDVDEDLSVKGIVLGIPARF